MLCSLIPPLAVGDISVSYHFVLRTHLFNQSRDGRSHAEDSAGYGDARGGYAARED